MSTILELNNPVKALVKQALDRGYRVFLNTSDRYPHENNTYGIYTNKDGTRVIGFQDNGYHMGYMFTLCYKFTKHYGQGEILNGGYYDRLFHDENDSIVDIDKIRYKAEPKSLEDEFKAYGDSSGYKEVIYNKNNELIKLD